jgi:hypothetical protein
MIDGILEKTNNCKPVENTFAGNKGFESLNRNETEITLIITLPYFI